MKTRFSLLLSALELYCKPDIKECHKVFGKVEWKTSILAENKTDFFHNTQLPRTIEDPTYTFTHYKG